MNNELVCIIDPFIINQKIIYPNGEEILIPMDMIPNYAVTSYHADNSFDTIHFFGNKDYINGLINEIYRFEDIKYSQNTIKIEVN